MIEYQEEEFENILFDFNNLLSAHMAEMNYFEKNGATFNPDYSKYLRAQQHGKAMLVTAKDDGRLIGYIVFFVDTHIRYKDTLYATEDLYYVHPDYRRRGIAKELFKVAEDILKDFGVKFILATTKVYHDRSGLLEQSGYEQYEKKFGKKIS